MFSNKERCVNSELSPTEIENRAIREPQTAMEHSAVIRASRRMLQDYLLAASAIGMTRARALHYAIADVKRECGVDWEERLHVDVGVDTLPAEYGSSADSDIALFLRQWGEGDLGIPYRATRSTTLFARYVSWCTEAGIRALNLPRFINGIKRQWGACASVKRRWKDENGEHGPNGLIDPPDVALRAACADSRDVAHGAGGAIEAGI